MNRAFFFSISLLLTNSFFAEGKSFSCDPKKYLPEDLANKVLVHRESGFNICLTCEGETCKFKQQLLDNSDTLTICKRLFCTASFASRGFEIPPGTPRGKSSLSYKNSITKLGEIKEKILLLDNENRHMSYRVIKSPVPLEHHLAEIKLTESETNKTKLYWRSEIKPDTFEKLIKDGMEASIQMIKKIVE